jgi:hypothetical protein
VAQHGLGNEHPSAEVPLPQLVNQVSAGHKAGDIDAVPEEVVPDCVNLSFYFTTFSCRSQ